MVTVLGCGKGCSRTCKMNGNVQLCHHATRLRAPAYPSSDRSDAEMGGYVAERAWDAQRRRPVTVPPVAAPLRHSFTLPSFSALVLPFSALHCSPDVQNSACFLRRTRESKAFRIFLRKAPYEAAAKGSTSGVQKHKAFSKTQLSQGCPQLHLTCLCQGSFSCEV